MISRNSGFGSRGNAPSASGVIVPLPSAPLPSKELTTQQKKVGQVLLRFLRLVVCRRTIAKRLLREAAESPAAGLQHNVLCLYWSLRVWLRLAHANTPAGIDHPMSSMDVISKSLAMVGKNLHEFILTKSESVGSSDYCNHQTYAWVTRSLQFAVAVVDAHNVQSLSRHLLPPTLLLSSIQTLLGLRDAQKMALVAGLTDLREAALVLRLVTMRARTFVRSSQKGSTKPPQTLVDVVVRYLTQHEKRTSTATAQETLVVDALYKVLWFVVSCAFQAQAEPTATSVIASIVSLFGLLRGQRMRTVANALWADSTLQAKCLHWVGWLGLRASRCLPHPTLAPVYGGLLLLQLHLLHQAALVEGDGALVVSTVDLVTSWWWDTILLGTAASEGGGKGLTSAAWISDSTKEVARIVARDDALMPVWGNYKLITILCLPPQREGEDQGLGSASKMKTGKSNGFFAELRRITKDERKFLIGDVVPWEQQSLLRRKQRGGDDPLDADGVEKTVSAVMSTFAPPLWSRGVTLLALTTLESLQTLNGLAIHGPKVLHRLLRVITDDTLLPTLLDMLHVMDLPVMELPSHSTVTTPGAPLTFLGTTSPYTPYTFVMTQVRSMAMLAEGTVSLLLQLATHLLLVSGDENVEKDGCPLPLTRLHVLVDLCNVLILSTVKRKLRSSSNAALLTPSTSATRVRSVTLVQNNVVVEWLRCDSFRLQQAAVIFTRALIDRSLRVPRITHYNPNLKTKEREELEEHPERSDERYWFLDRDTQEALFPGSKSAAAVDSTIEAGSKGGTLCAWSSMQVAVLQSMPHVVPFVFRIEYFVKLLAEDRRRVVGTRDSSNLKLGLIIRRDHQLEDLMQQLSQVCANNPHMAVDGKHLRSKWHITFVDSNGMKEAGIDAGGVFKEFMERVVKESFNPDLGLFVPVQPVDDAPSSTRGAAATRVLHPNPHARAVFSDAHDSYLQYFRFLGILVAKSIYEGVVLNLEFAPSFLNNILGRGNCIDDLKAVDAQQFRSLQLLKDMENVSDATVYFCVDDDVMGQTHTTDLIPNGRDIQVTNENVVRYMHLAAHHLLVKRNRDETASFAAGFFEVLPKTAVSFLFHQRELQQLISGRRGLRLDVADLKKHARLVGGIEEGSRTLTLLWEVLDEFSTEDQGRFLQFCTGCSKPPLLGFGSMNPPFSIRGVKEGSILNFIVDIDRLPSASTCFNLLKLPLYRNKTNMMEKLQQAIRADSGFQLS